MVGASFSVAAVAQILRSKKGITANGNAQVSTAQSQFGGSSALFDGTGDWLQVADHPSFTFGTDDFTIEFWYRAVNLDNAKIIWDQRPSGTQTTQPTIYTAAGTLNYYTNGSNRITGSGLSLNIWYHIAVSRSGTSTRMFVNGTQVGSTYSDSTNYTSASTGIRIASDQNASGNSVNGYIDEVRASNTARYTANFTPSTTPFTNDANTLLLIHANGTNASTFFEDDNGVRGPKGIIAIGNAQVDTAQSQFGGASLLLDGTGDRLDIGSSSDLALGTGNFTIECWIRFASRTGNQVIIDYRPGSNGIHVSAGHIDGAPYLFVDGSNRIYNATSFAANNTWYHWALVRSAGTSKIYVNGTQITGSYTDSNNYTATSPSIGELNKAWNTTGFGINGHMDEFRVSNSARYTANFTAPTQPFVNDSNTVLLIHADGTDASTVFRDDNGQARTQAGISAVGNAQIDTAQSKFGGASLLNGVADYLRIDNTTGLNFAGDFTVETFIRPSTLNTFNTIYTNWNASANGLYFAYWTGPDKFSVFINGSERISASNTLSTNTWYHVALVRSGSNLTLYRDGTSIGTGTFSGTVLAPTFSGIGINTDGIQQGLVGHLDEVRISDIARYTANFTAPTAPFQNDANTLLLIHADGTDASTVFFDDNGIAPYTP
jgi:hypothetical protein